MGGTYKGIGNITFNSEFNFNQDPEAAHIVLNAGFSNVILVPWETAFKTSPCTPEHISKLYDDSTPLGVMHKQSNDYIAGLDGKYIICDTLCAIVLIDETSILSSFEAFGVVDISPGMSKGAITYYSEKSMKYQIELVKTQFGIDASKPNVKVITKIDLEKAIDIISAAKSGLKKEL
jgi:purine nucleosidase